MFRKQNEETDDFKKKREEYSINLRRNNRQEIFNKRRNIEENDTREQSSNRLENIVDLRYVNEIKMLHEKIYSDEHLNEYISMLDSSDFFTQLQGAIALKSIMDVNNSLTDNDNRIVSELFKQGAIQRIIDFAKQKEQPQLKLEAMSIISNLTYLKNICNELLKCGVAQIIAEVLQENQVFTIDFAIIAMGNISVDNVKFRDLLLSKGFLERLYKVLASSQRRATYLNCLWGITNLCRGDHLPIYALIQTAIPVLCRELKNKIFEQTHKSQPARVYSDILWTLSILTQKSKARADRLIESDVIPLILKATLSQVNQIYFPAIRIVGNLACLGEKQTGALLDAGLLDFSFKLLYHPKKQMKREICWILSNIAAGTFDQVNKLISRIDILDKINEMFCTQDLETKGEICWIYPNLGHAGDKQKAVQLYLHYDVMKTYVELLDQKNVMLLETVLKSMYKIFMVANKALIDGNNAMLMKFMEYGGANKIDKLQQHESNVIYKAVVAILTKFFEVEDKN